MTFDLDAFSTTVTDTEQVPDSTLDALRTVILTEQERRTLSLIHI